MNQNKIKSEKLNIGYLLPESRDICGDFLGVHFLKYYNKQSCKIFCYADGGKDKFALQETIGIWRECSGMKPDLVAQIMYNDKIHILVCLAKPQSEFAGAILAKRPAQIQVSFIGYFNTTKQRTIDYLLTDKYCDPVGQNEDYFTEKLYRLPQSHFYYEAVDDGIKSKNPFKENGYITFGSFHNFTRLSDDFMRLWGKILQAAPEARLALRSRIFGSGYGVQEAKFRLNRLGVPVERVIFLPADYTDAAGYRSIDILLDTYPYQGRQTTCEALYMGVPVIVLTGKKHSVRFGYSILKNIGLEMCIAFSSEEYVRKAAALASSSYKLMNLRKSLRQNMTNSPLMDLRRYMGNVERAYLAIWQEKLAKEEFEKLQKEVLALLATMQASLEFICLHLMERNQLALIEQMLADTGEAFAKLDLVLAMSQELRPYREGFSVFLQQIKAVRLGMPEADYAAMGDIVKNSILRSLRVMIKKIAAIE